MRFITAVLLACCFAALGADDGLARKTNVDAKLRFSSPPGPNDLPPDLQSLASRPQLATAASDTFHLAWFSFNAGGSPDAQGWTSVDLTAQLGDFFHVADATELNGGSFGRLQVLEGAQSMWCGAPPSGTGVFCAYATLPGYGNDWSQRLTSKVFAGCDSLTLYYKIAWDSEAGYDKTFAQWRDANSTTWQNFDAANGGPPNNFYEGTGSLTECVGARSSGDGLQVRFWFQSDGAWSDEDGQWPTDGAVTLDSITVVWYDEVPPASGNWVVSATYFEGFEDESPGDTATNDGCWTGTGTPGFGDFAALYSGTTVHQEDPCVTNFSFMWGFFDDPAITAYLCHTPIPLPGQGAIRFGPDENGLYLNNAIVSSPIPNVGAGDQYWLDFGIYRDLPLDNLILWHWSVRNIVAGCAGPWLNPNFMIYFWSSGWSTDRHNISVHIDPLASDIQISLGAVDACAVWCGVFGSGACHSHGPLFDDVHLRRVNVVGPEFSVRHIDLFQDTFAEDGTLTGSARADIANDIAPNVSPTILPGDSLTMTASGVGVDPNTGVGPSAYVYVAVWPPNQPDKAPANLEASETRAGVGSRYPLVGTVNHDGVTWACYRMDSVVTSSGAVLDKRYCFDLNDAVFTPGDTICYVLAADDGTGNTNYWSRRINGQGSNFVTDDLWEALSSPLEFTILPTTGYPFILLVDDADHRSGPLELFYWSIFDVLGFSPFVDRYDVLGPSSDAGNSLASRVTNPAVQLRNYEIIVWESGSYGGPGDGWGAEKSDDYSLLFSWVDASSNMVSLFLSGDDIAEGWVSSPATGATNLRALYLNFNLVDGNHVAAGEPVTPLLELVFCDPPSPTLSYVYGGCPSINDFDVLDPTGSALSMADYPSGSGSALIGQNTPSSLGGNVGVALSGFSFPLLRDVEPVFPSERVWFFYSATRCISGGAGAPFGPVGIEPVVSNYLMSAAPNPFNPETTIRYGVRTQGHVTLRVYNVAGQLVRTLVNEVKTPVEGGFAVTWDGRDNRGTQVSTGVYFYKLSTRGFTQTKKMVLLK